MKPKLALVLTSALCAVAATFTATNVFGQVTYTWSGKLSGGDGTNIATVANWTTNESLLTPAVSAPSGNSQDAGQWDNLVGGNVVVTYSATGGLPSTGGGTEGINFNLTGNQVGNVQLVPVGHVPTMTANIGFFGINDSSPSASFILGDLSGNALNIVGRPQGAVHDLVNNSTGPCIINANVRWQAGGGNPFTLEFDGSGNWNVTNDLANANNTGMLIEKSGSGTMYWNGPSIAFAAPNSTINSPITINSGTMVLQWDNALINGVAFVNDGVLEFDAPGQLQTLSGAITGVGNLQVGGGNLVLNGANAFSGNTILTGGEAVLDIAESLGVSGPIGEGGIITFAGGTLGFTGVNTYDYSPRFDTSANQRYSFDTGGQIVTLTNVLTSSGGTLTKLGSGVLDLTGANTYSGLTAVGAGRLNIEGSAGTGNITVSNGAVLGVFEGGAQIKPGTLTVGNSGGAVLEFNNVTSTTTPALVAGSISESSPITVNINGGVFTVGQSYPLFSWSSGSPPPVNLGIVIGGAGNLTTNGNTIQLNITAISFVWTGNNNGNWDTSTANNWKFNGVVGTYTNGGPALFDDTSTGTTNVTLSAALSPSISTINNNNLQYSIASSGANLIGGSGGLIKDGNNVCALSGGVNTYNGVTTVLGGTLKVGTLANGGTACDIGAAANSAANLVFNGGTLQYTGGAVASDRLFSVGTFGGTLDDEGSTLTLNNPGAMGFSGTGPRNLTLTGSDTSGDTLAAVIGDNGGPTAVTMNGAGVWILTGLSTYSGLTTINNGTLQVGNGGNSAIGNGSIVDNSNLVYNTSGTVTNNIISGIGTVIVNGSGTVILPGNNTYSGGTTINAGTLQIGNGGPTGQLNNNAPIVDNSLLVFNSSGTLAFGQGSPISGSGNVIVEGSGGLFKAIGANSYTGWTLIEPGANFQPCEGNQGVLASSVVTNNGTLTLVRQDNAVFVYSGPIVGTGTVQKDLNNPNPGDVTLTGTNTYTGGTTINGGAIILGDNIHPGAGSIVGNVAMTYNSLQQAGSTITFNRPDTYIFSGIISGYGSLMDAGTGTLILTGNNTYTNSLTIITNGATLQVGNGGTVGSISVDNVTNDGALFFDRSDNINIANYITGSNGIVAQIGTGTVTLSDTNYYTVATIVQNGTLIIAGLNTPNGVSEGGDLDAYGGGTLISGGTGIVVSNGVTGNMNISNATVVVTVNKSLSPPNTYYVVTNSVTAIAGGALNVSNVGAAIHAGDIFTVFNKAVANGNLLTVTGSGVTWENDLASNGTIKALTSQASAPYISHISVSGQTLTISATGGQANGQYVLLGTTNIVSGIWTPIFTNSFNASGNIVNLSTNIVNTHVPYEFYKLSQ